MKMKESFIILMTLVFMTMFSQGNRIEYPKFEVDSLGQKVIIMTISQAMKLNNNSNILEKFERLAEEMKDYESLTLKVINEKDQAIAKLDIVVKKLDGQIVVKDDKIKSLQEEILSWMVKNRVLETQLANRQSIIYEKDQQLSRLKTKMIIGGGLGTIALVGLILTSIGIIH